MPTNYIVAQGQCVASVAYELGYFPASIWNDPANAELKEKRKDSNVLAEGDVLVIPDKRTREADCPIDRITKFRRKGTPAQLRIRLLVEDEPRSQVKYILKIGDQLISGITGSDGRILHTVPPDVEEGVLIVEDDEPIRLPISHLDPIDTLTGVRSRLRNLGYHVPKIDGDLDEVTEFAIRSFQARNDLPDSGKMDSVTQEKLKAVHGV